MSHGIMELDKMVVGFTDLYGKAWHDHPNCRHIDGAVSFDDAEATFDYKVEKVPVVIQGTDIAVPGSFALIRRDGEENKVTVVYPSVGDRYEVIQNRIFLAWIEAGILVPFNVSIESVGTLMNGHKAFVNIVLGEHTVPGDVSPTITRLLYSNSFGLESYMACVHSTRLVCQNTLRMAQVQGAANNTLRKFRHTKGAPEKIEAHLVDLAQVIASTREHNQQLDLLASMKVTPEQVDAFMDMLVPLPKDADGKSEEGRGLTRRQNQRDAILAIFEGKDDLKGKILHTRYSLLQAVTDWVDHDSPVHGDSDSLYRFWQGIWGNKDEFKQKAWEAINAIR